jgi:hypothetical protein
MRAVEKDVKDGPKGHGPQGHKDKLYFDHYNSNDLERIIDTQHKVVKLMKA